jgi:membrane protease subunit (stomatin/prohibitin family)
VTTPKRPVQAVAALEEFVRRGVAAQKAANEQLHLGAAFGWECPRCAVVNADERPKCVNCGTVKR